MNETQRARRGHAFLPPKAVLSKIPALYATEKTDPDDKIIHAHYFSAGSDHYVAELDPETGEAFGYARLAAFPEGAEWGYFDLSELEQVNAHGGLVIVERDCHWQPRKFSEIKP
jgi:Protein of unknown function (DUF2958)